ncbi:PAW domain-containing protein [Caenorhabditis elegans]|uniref:PAW domain-containing protein n=1 Tax=Caenorhabditis elegans TaxID=6239 RepID=O76676_CAEEL|nr:PAW domain-containing protein [Caenorhabditis elegans]CCD62923.1 PAW domain-containing protein [Caenorhabditis elegans]|eukprot:NP_503935.2 Uncharacterized protein CELE_C04E12.5 [Caenorhabditis elegans]
MTSQNAPFLYSQIDPLLLSRTNRPQPRDRWKTIIKITTTFIGVLMVTTPIVFGLSGVAGNTSHFKNISSTTGKYPEKNSTDFDTSTTTVSEANTTFDTTESLYLAEEITTQEKLIQLNPNSGHNYVKFTYDILNNTYSHDNIDGSPVAPYFVDKIERVVDRKNNEAYLHQEFPDDFSNMYWAFSLKNDGKSVEKVVISIPGIEEIVNNRAGVVETCPNFLINCFNIPVEKSLTIEQQMDKLYISIMLQKDIKVLKTKLKGVSNVESFKIEVYWKNMTMDSPTTTTPGSIATTKSSTTTITETHHQPDISSTRLTEHQDIIQLTPKSGQDYAKFTYDVISNTYSQSNEDGSPVKPYLASNVEHVVDRRLNVAYIHMKEPINKRIGLINWEFDFRFPGRSVEKLEIKLTGMDEIVHNGGTANACLHDSFKCTAIPINGSLTIEKPQFNKFFMQIELFKDIKVFKTELNDRSSAESISIVVYWS